MVRSSLFTALAALAALWSAPAGAACPSSELILGSLTCGDSVSDQVGSSESSSLGGAYTTTNYYYCPDSTATQTRAEDVYEFTCPVTGTVVIDLAVDCDMDFYVLGSSCSPYTDCLGDSINAGSVAEQVTFACTAGDTYYVVVEGFGFALPMADPTSCTSSEGFYTITVDTVGACDPDADGDGYDAIAFGGTDCDDTRASVYPGATETCNGRDDDCDGTTDESSASDATTYYRDADGDGYGNASVSTRSCSAVSGYVTNDDDCDDTRSTSKPGGTETCDGLDNDCDGSVDEAVGSTWYRDADSDGYGSATSTTVSCSMPSGYVANSSDCNDGSSAISPAATETCDGIDNDCDSSVDESGGSTWYLDSDGDGYGETASTRVACSMPSGYVATSGDCNDRSNTVHPYATEYCNSVDDDCDGSTDESGAADESTWYRDADGDGYGTTTSTTRSCSRPTGYVSTSTDCNDANAAAYPTATEVCDGVDNDCDGASDESGGSTWYADTDGDGYGDPSVATVSCSGPTGYVSNRNDCDDDETLINPGATEYCDGVDNDCDNVVDEDDAYDVTTWYADTDGDGYGDPSQTDLGCTAAAGYVANDDDCWDGDATVKPGGTENPDGVDDDCDGIVDEGTTLYDDDGDGVTEAGGDCDDASAGDHPGAVEACDGDDDDCDGIVDNGTTCFDDDGDGWTEDDGDCNDGDGAVSPGTPEVADNGVDDNCDGSVDGGSYDPDGDGYTAAGGDCGEDDPATYPAAPEQADGVDNDCDGIVDEGTDDYDDDGDGWTEVDGDCNDADADVNPDATDIENGVDDDCDGRVDQGGEFVDDDGDGYSDAAGDCDDTNGAISPDADEALNGLDDDCDGAIDEDVEDVDGDGYTEADGDCDDRSGWAHPGRRETCDGIDNDCNGEVDDGCLEVDDTPKVEGDGCGCASSGDGAAGLLPLLVGLAGVIRRRRAA